MKRLNGKLPLWLVIWIILMVNLMYWGLILIEYFFTSSDDPSPYFKGAPHTFYHTPLSLIGITGSFASLLLILMLLYIGGENESS